jgi:hypothetical protein
VVVAVQGRQAVQVVAAVVPGRAVQVQVAQEDKKILPRVTPGQ